MLKKTTSFGCIQVHGSISEKAVNMVLTFEEALQLQVALQAAVLDLNSYNRSTTEGKKKAVGLCYFPDHKRLTVLRVDKKP